MAFQSVPINARPACSWSVLPRESYTKFVTRRAHKRARLLGYAYASAPGDPGQGSAGDPEIQDDLVKLLNQQVGAKQAQAQPSAAETDEASGNPEVQDTLSKLVRLQVGAEQVKARAAEGSETLKQTAEEVC